MPNLRDLGGWPAGPGRVRHGLLFRSAQLTVLEGAAADEFARLGIRAVYDMRTDGERAAAPEQLPPGARHVVVDIVKDLPGAAPTQIFDALSDPQAAERIFGEGRGVALFEQGYRTLIGLPSALTGYREFFTDIAEAENGPILFHCTTGKDRTGWAAAALLLLLGVAEDDVYAEYLLTNEQLLPTLKPFFDRFVAAGGNADLLIPVLGVQREYLAAALDEMRQRYGSIDGYFSDGLQLPAETVQRLRNAYVA
ncbi:tyrosine-protein phosphatase [Rhizocola hellebori]|uniref:tyrosine-protein phosphatase n=1 Tax=Rhizocola hellebori TaxID=1392758 RepID=UPI001941A0F5|nr:tyrosine-protein phosphatase [Rhizocola hellebori]